MAIEVRNISKNFKAFKALDNVSLKIEEGELIALLGPSGSGKTTLLRIIAGLEHADSGEVLLEDRPTHHSHVRERQVGFVFQHYALFKHMTVYDNVAFGLKVRPKDVRPSDVMIRQKVMDLLKLVHLDALYDRYPSQLSGGQRQRVALARALAVEPKVLLLDEPFGALDAKVRKELRRWMRRLHDEIHITSIFVTHDQEEAMEVSDRLVVMSQGRVEQVGTPEQVYHHPANSFVYDFLGNYNEFEGWKDDNGVIHLAEMDVIDVQEPATEAKSPSWLGRDIRNLMQRVAPGLVTPKPDLPTVARKKAVSRPINGRPVKIYARPHEMFVVKTPDEHEYITTRVIHLNPAGSLVKIELERRNGTLMQVEIQKNVFDALSIRKGDALYVRPKQTRVFE